MHVTSLRKVGGSTMLAVPPAVLASPGLAPGSKVGVQVHGGCLVVEPHQKPRYSLNELLAQSKRRRTREKAERETV